MSWCVMFNNTHANTRLYKNFIISISDGFFFYIYKMVDKSSKKTSYCNKCNGVSSQEERETSSLIFIKNLISLIYL
jgi:hypothetical protein